MLLITHLIEQTYLSFSGQISKYEIDRRHFIYAISYLLFLLIMHDNNNYH